MLVLLTIFGCLYHASGIPVDRSVSSTIISTDNEINHLSSIEDIKLAVSQVMTNLKSSNKSAGLIEAIIDEVELQLSRDSSLPRLTRGEIIDLIEKVSITDLEELEKLNTNRTNHQRAVMLVLPYSPSNDTDVNLQELYTKPPVVKIIDDKNEKPKNKGSNNLQELYTKPPVLKLIDDQINRAEMKPVRRRRPTLPPTIPQADISSTTISSTSANVEELLQPTSNYKATPSSSIEYQFSSEPLKPTKINPPKKYPVKHSNKITTLKYPENNVFSSQGINIIPAPKLNQEQDTSQVPDEILIAQESLPPKSSQTYVLNDFNIPASVKYNNIFKKPTNIMSKISTTTPASDMTDVANNLTPEMQKLLVSFGLFPDPNQKKPEYKPEEIYVAPEKPYFEPDSFVQFKPLPDSAPTSEDMASFLEGFGLDKKKTKNQKVVKSIKNHEDSSPKEIEIDIFPDEVKDVFMDLGLTNRQSKKISLEGVKNYVKKPQHKNDNQELEELKKLMELVDFIKKLDKMNETDLIPESDLKQVKELVNSLNKYDDKNDKDSSKVTVKRQANTTISETIITTDALPKTEDSSSSSSESKSEEQSSEESSTPSSSTPNLKDLEDSFGGTPEASSTTTTTTEEPSTTSRSGFYHLVDWNSFLEVDDQKGRRVNIRFQPRSGDPKRFYSVTVP